MIRALPPVAAALLAAGCGEGAVTPVHESGAAALTLTTVRGDSQLGPPGRLLEEFLVFRVTDPAGSPVVALRVEWEVVAGGGQVSGKRHETDLEGLAAGNFTLGAELGEHVARAVVQDSLSIAFTAFAVAPEPEPGPKRELP